LKDSIAAWLDESYTVRRVVSVAALKLPAPVEAVSDVAKPERSITSPLPEISAICPVKLEGSSKTMVPLAPANAIVSEEAPLTVNVPFSATVSAGAMTMPTSCVVVCAA
jgi:hypothetical protein